MTDSKNTQIAGPDCRKIINRINFISAEKHRTNIEHGDQPIL